jgi:hypothetical protein
MFASMVIVVSVFGMKNVFGNAEQAKFVGPSQQRTMNDESNVTPHGSG